MYRRVICILSAAWVFLLLRIPALASGSNGSIRVVPDWAGNRVMGGQVTLCRIGDLTVQGYRLTDGLANWIVSRQEILSEDFLQWALTRHWDNRVTVRIRDEQGAFFGNLEEGVYLVTQKEAAEGFSAFLPFLVLVPTAGCMELTVNPEVISLAEPPKTGDRPAPIFGAMGISLGAVIVMVLAENRKK